MGSIFLEDARHSSVLCICKYFVLLGIQEIPRFVRAPVHAKYKVEKTFSHCRHVLFLHCKIISLFL
jgi:hypothetical protein